MAISVGIVNAPSACAAEDIVSFKDDILPLLKWRCASCHEPGGAGYEKSGLDLTTYAGVMKGTKFGPMIIPRDPESSNLMLLLDWRASPALRMPHGESSCRAATAAVSALGFGKALRTIDRIDTRTELNGRSAHGLRQVLFGCSGSPSSRAALSGIRRSRAGGGTISPTQFGIRRRVCAK